MASAGAQRAALASTLLLGMPVAGYDIRSGMVTSRTGLGAAMGTRAATWARTDGGWPGGPEAWSPGPHRERVPAALLSGFPGSPRQSETARWNVTSQLDAYNELKPGMWLGPPLRMRRRCTITCDGRRRCHLVRNRRALPW